MPFSLSLPRRRVIIFLPGILRPPSHTPARSSTPFSHVLRVHRRRLSSSKPKLAPNARMPCTARTRCPRNSEQLSYCPLRHHPFRPLMPCEHAISCLVQSGSKSMSHELGMPHGVRPAAAHRRTATSPRRPVGRRPATRKRSFSPADRSPDGAPGPRCATADCPHPAECMRGTHHGGACVRKKGPSSVHARTGLLGAPFIETAAPHASLGSTTKYRPVQSHGAYVVKRVDSVIDHQSWESPVVRTSALELRAAGAEQGATSGHVVFTQREVLFCRWGAGRSE